MLDIYENNVVKKLMDGNCIESCMGTDCKYIGVTLKSLV